MDAVIEATPMCAIANVAESHIVTNVLSLEYDVSTWDALVLRHISRGGVSLSAVPNPATSYNTLDEAAHGRLLLFGGGI